MELVGPAGVVEGAAARQAGEAPPLVEAVGVGKARIGPQLDERGTSGPREVLGQRVEPTGQAAPTEALTGDIEAAVRNLLDAEGGG